MCTRAIYSKACFRLLTACCDTSTGSHRTWLLGRHMTSSKSATREISSPHRLPNVRRTVVVASGKGGVGKSTCAGARVLQSWRVSHATMPRDACALHGIYGMLGMLDRAACSPFTLCCKAQVMHNAVQLLTCNSAVWVHACSQSALQSLFFVCVCS